MGKEKNISRILPAIDKRVRSIMVRARPIVNWLHPSVICGSEYLINTNHKPEPARSKPCIPLAARSAWEGPGRRRRRRRRSGSQMTAAVAGAQGEVSDVIQSWRRLRGGPLITSKLSAMVKNSNNSTKPHVCRHLLSGGWVWWGGVSWGPLTINWANSLMWENHLVTVGWTIAVHGRRKRVFICLFATFYSSSSESTNAVHTWASIEEGRGCPAQWKG